MAKQSSLGQLCSYSKIVADTGSFNLLKNLKAEDGTTNPTLLLAACQQEEYAAIVSDAIAYGKSIKNISEEEMFEEICDRLAVNFGIEILKIVPGVVSTEVPAALSFDTEKSIMKARKLIGMYEKMGVSRNRVYIKMATTWESIQAAKVLELEGIKCNMTLLFSLCQAIAAAEAGVTLISPFVGRILDWYKMKFPSEDFEGSKDPGVKSVKQIFNYYKKFGFKTIVMGASFRNVKEIFELAGCDKLTISPKLLMELEKMQLPVNKILDEKTIDPSLSKIEMNESVFRWMLNEDPMATEKLSEGIRVFHADLLKLKAVLRQKFE